MCQLVPWWDCWKLPDGSLSHPLRRLELAAFVSPFCLLQIITGGLLCAFPCGSALKTYPRLILACAPGQGLVIWVLLRGLPRLVLEPVWEPSLPALGLEGWCPGSASPTQVGKGALHLLTAASEWLLRLQNLPKAARKDNSTHWTVVETSRSRGAVAGALTLGVTPFQEKNVHFTYKNASHPFIHRGEMLLDDQKISKLQ